MSVKSFKYNANVQLTKNFNTNEFQCQGKGHKHDVKIDVELVKQLQDFMNINGYNKAIISSAYRCKKHNKAVGGASGSNHCKGKAVDICFYKDNKKVLAKEVCCKAQEYGFKGIAYIDKYHVHLDNRTLGVYRGDETKGYYNNVPNGDFYKYFGISKPTDKYNLTRTLKKGDKGSDVKELQKSLKISVDGIFGNKTLAKVKSWQKSHTYNGKKLVVDGIVGKDTAHTLGWLYKGK